MNSAELCRPPADVQDRTISYCSPLVLLTFLLHCKNELIQEGKEKKTRKQREKHNLERRIGRENATNPQKGADNKKRTCGVLLGFHF